MLCVVDALRDTVMRLIVRGEAMLSAKQGNENLSHAQSGSGLCRHMTQGPARYASTSCGRAHPVADVAHVVVKLVAQNDLTKHLLVLDAPTW